MALTRTDELLEQILEELKKLNKDDGEDFIFSEPYKDFIRVNFKKIESVSSKTMDKNNKEFVVIHLEDERSFIFYDAEKDRFLAWFEKQKQKAGKHG